MEDTNVNVIFSCQNLKKIKSYNLLDMLQRFAVRNSLDVLGFVWRYDRHLAHHHDVVILPNDFVNPKKAK